MDIPRIQFIATEIVEDDDPLLEQDEEFVAEREVWVADENFLHMRKQNLKNWVGIDQVGAPAEQEWYTCVQNIGYENKKKDPEKCPKRQITYTTFCENVFDADLRDFVAHCDFCVQMYNMTEPVCTPKCENATSYLNEFNEEVFDLRCIDPIYQ